MFKNNRFEIPFTPRAGLPSVICQQVMRVCITLTEPDDIVNQLCFMLCFDFQLIELEFKSKEC